MIIKESGCFCLQLDWRQLKDFRGTSIICFIVSNCQEGIYPRLYYGISWFGWLFSKIFEMFRKYGKIQGPKMLKWFI